MPNELELMRKKKSIKVPCKTIKICNGLNGTVYRIVVENGFYALPPTDIVYTLLICDRDGTEYCLPDISRSKEHALRVLEVFACGEVTADTAADVAEELLNMDPDFLI